MPRKNIMLCAPFEVSRYNRWKTPYVYFQPKLDGDRIRAILEPGQVKLLSSEEQDRNFALPHIVEQLEAIAPALNSCGIFELDGEGYKHEWSHETIHGVCARTKNLHPDHAAIEYHIFDHIVEETPQDMRFTDLSTSSIRALLSYAPNLKLVPTVPLTSLNDVMVYYKAAVDTGYEGMIIRHPYAPYSRKRSTFIQKFKPKKHDVYIILGVNEEISLTGEPKSMVGSFACVDPEGTTFNISAGMTNSEKANYWANRESLIGKQIKVYYQATTANGKPKFATDLEILDA